MDSCARSRAGSSRSSGRAESRRTPACCSSAFTPMTARDVDDRKAFEEQLRHRAFHDALTGLANRALFYDRIEHALTRGTRDGVPVAVLFIALDDFKAINDRLGHAN